MDCKNCGGEIPTFVTIEGRTTRVFWKRKYCFVCSPWGAANNQKLELVRKDGMKACSGCGNEAPKEDFKRNGICRRCLSDSARNKRNGMKLRCVEFLGGKCIKCGYDRCLAALEFHHRDPNKKDFEVGRGKTKDFEKLKVELLKCDLLCRNCHAEAHWLRAEQDSNLQRITALPLELPAQM